VASKWLDFWAYANWIDVAKRPLFTILGEIKNACDERQACVEAVHSADFDADNEWPIDEGDLYANAGGTPDTLQKMENALYPKPAVETDSINTGGGAVTTDDIPTSYNLSELLEDELGYASGTLLSESEDLAKMTHIKQWFEVLNYPEYYEVVPIEKTAGGAESEWVTDVETQFIRSRTEYRYETGTPSFTSCICEITNPRLSSTPNDVYAANDLNESSPFSTITDVRDYTLEKYDDELANDTWYTAISDAETSPVEALIDFQVANEEVGTNVLIRCEIRTRRIRFKVPDIFRATTPNKFTATIKLYGFYDTGNYSSDFYFDDLGTGETEDEVVFLTLTADGSDYYYLEIASPDFESPTVPSMPALGDNETNGYGLVYKSLSVDLPTLNTIAHAVYLHVNKTDGSAFEYHTPP
jgi:hypothetical protein